MTVYHWESSRAPTQIMPLTRSRRTFQEVKEQTIVQQLVQVITNNSNWQRGGYCGGDMVRQTVTPRHCCTAGYSNSHTQESTLAKWAAKGGVVCSFVLRLSKSKHGIVHGWLSYRLISGSRSVINNWFWLTRCLLRRRWSSLNERTSVGRFPEKFVLNCGSIRFNLNCVSLGKPAIQGKGWEVIQDHLLWYFNI